MEGPIQLSDIEALLPKKSYDMVATVFVKFLQLEAYSRKQQNSIIQYRFFLSYH